MLGILGICIKIEKLSFGKRVMEFPISRWHVIDFGTLSSHIRTSWHRWCSRRSLCWLWWMWTGAFAALVCMQVLCCAMLTRKTASSLIFTNNCQVSVQFSLHLSMPRKLNSPIVLCLDFGESILDHITCFLYCCLWKLSCGHFGHILHKAHVGLF